MIRYTLGRLAQAVLAVWAVVTIVFCLTRLSGNTAELMAPPQATPEDVAAIEHNLGLDRSLVVQYGKYLWNLLHGDLGESFSYRQPVSSLLATALPKSIELGLVAFAFALVVGGALGTLSAFRAGSIVDRSAKGVALLGQSVPAFWFGIVLVYVFSIKLGWVPPFGYGSWKQIVLPAIALGWLPLAGIGRLTRSAVLEVLQSDHTTFERSKGISTRELVAHTLRNASLPVVTLAGIQLGWLISGTVVIETLFAWPGTGQLAIQAINSRDYAVVQGVALVVTAIFVFLLFLVDLSYGWLDPRVRRAAT
ncbi:MAG: ABC transporter permease [Ilumatobacteraceae bacterium]